MLEYLRKNIFPLILLSESDTKSCLHKIASKYCLNSLAFLTKARALKCLGAEWVAKRDGVTIQNCLQGLLDLSPYLGSVLLGRSVDGQFLALWGQGGYQLFQVYRLQTQNYSRIVSPCLWAFGTGSCAHPCFWGRLSSHQQDMVWEWFSKCHGSVVIFKRGGSCERTKTTFPLLPHGDFYITLWGAEREEITLLPVERESISSCLTGRNVGFSVHMSGPLARARPHPPREAEKRYKVKSKNGSNWVKLQEMQ